MTKVQARLLCQQVELPLPPPQPLAPATLAVELRWGFPPLEGSVHCADVSTTDRQLPLNTPLPIDFTIETADGDVLTKRDTTSTLFISVHCQPSSAPAAPRAYSFTVDVAQISKLHHTSFVMDPDSGARLHHMLLLIHHPTHICPSFALGPQSPKKGAPLTRPNAKAEADVLVSALLAYVLQFEGSHPQLVESCRGFLAATTRSVCSQAAHGLVGAMYAAVVDLADDRQLRSLIARSLYKAAAFLPGYEEPKARPLQRSPRRRHVSEYPPGLSVTSPCSPPDPQEEDSPLSARGQNLADWPIRSSWTADVWVKMANNMRRASVTRSSSSTWSTQEGETPAPSTGVSVLWSDNCMVNLGDYAVICPISKGAFGRVFLAKDRATGQPWALKVLRKHDVMKKNMQTEVFRERDLMELISHTDVRRQHVVHVQCAFQSARELFIVQELMPGGDLLSVLLQMGDSRFSEPLTLQFTAEIVLALAFLHSLGVIHRDLKPDNILLAADGHLKLTDFGLSEAGQSPIKLDSDTGEVMFSPRRPSTGARGTIDYMAPELILERPHSFPVDWWSLGVIIFEFLTGCPPFNAETQSEVCQNILNLAVDWEEVPDPAATICRQLLRLDPKVRLGTGGDQEVKAHPFFCGIDWETLKTAPSLYTPRPMPLPEDCVANFEARQALFPFRQSDGVLRGSPASSDSVKGSFGDNFANFSMQLMSPRLLLGSPTMRTSGSPLRQFDLCSSSCS